MTTKQNKQTQWQEFTVPSFYCHADEKFIASLEFPPAVLSQNMEAFCPQVSLVEYCWAPINQRVLKKWCNILIFEVIFVHAHFI